MSTRPISGLRVQTKTQVVLLVFGWDGQPVRNVKIYMLVTVYSPISVYGDQPIPVWTRTNNKGRFSYHGWAGDVDIETIEKEGYAIDNAKRISWDFRYKRGQEDDYLPDKKHPAIFCLRRKEASALVESRTGRRGPIFPYPEKFYELDVVRLKSVKKIKKESRRPKEQADVRFTLTYLEDDNVFDLTFMPLTGCSMILSSRP